MLEKLCFTIFLIIDQIHKQHLDSCGCFSVQELLYFSGSIFIMDDNCKITPRRKPFSQHKATQWTSQYCPKQNVYCWCYMKSDNKRTQSNCKFFLLENILKTLKLQWKLCKSFFQTLVHPKPVTIWLTARLKTAVPWLHIDGTTLTQWEQMYDLFYSQNVFTSERKAVITCRVKTKHFGKNISFTKIPKKS